MVRLSIIILSFNTKDLTIKCLESIIKQYKKQLEKEEFETIIVDNGSTDDSVGAISNFQSLISNLQLIENKENLGFSKGNNVGAKKAKGKYLFFLNSDTEVLDRGLLQMINFLEENPMIGVLGARLINLDGSDQKSVGRFYHLGNVFLMLFGGERLGLLRSAPKNALNVDWVSGASMMVRQNIFERLGGFDEEFFMYMEDLELCYRVKKEGFKVYFYPYIKILHKQLGSSNKSFAIINIYKGLIYFYKKHKNIIEYVLLKTMLDFKAFILIVFGSITHNIYLSNTYKKAIKF